MPSYEKNKSSGLWSCRFREMGEDGAHHQKRLSGFKTKKDAQYGYEDYIKEAEAREAEKKAAEAAKKTDPNEITFTRLTEQFFEYKRTRVKPSTFYDAEKKIEAKILPYFGDKKIAEIYPLTILQWQSSLSSFSFQYQKNLFAFLRAIFIYGKKYHGIINPCENVDPPRNLEPKKEMKVWSKAQFIKAIFFEKSPEYSALFTTLFTIGCRRGEALALTWSDIDFKKGTININKSVTFKSVNKAAGARYEITTPKNKGSIRVAVAPKALMDQLKTYRDWQKKNRASQDFVFGGEAPPPATSIERHLTEIAKAAEIERIRVHDLRHSCASHLIHKGVNVVAVSRQLGHTNIEQTLNTYSHLLPDDNQLLRAAMESD